MTILGRDQRPQETVKKTTTQQQLQQHGKADVHWHKTCPRRPGFLSVFGQIPLGSRAEIILFRILNSFTVLIHVLKLR